jgi:hypothetical protein
MKFIGDLLTSESPVEWSDTIPFSDGAPNTTPGSAEYRNFSHTGCVLHYEAQIRNDYFYPWEGTSHDFSKEDMMKLKVEAKSVQDTRAIAAAGGKFTVTISPEVYMVDAFYVADQGQAERLLRAMTHAASLCGAATDQPF